MNTLWNVVYRHGDGTQGETRVEADTRTAAIAEMRARGLSVVNVTEAPDASKLARTEAARRATSRHRVVNAIAVAAALAAAAWYFLFREGAAGNGLLDDLRPSGGVSLDVVPEG